MEGYDAATYGQKIADIYDDHHPDPLPGQIELLYELAGEGPVLELGIGTGRIALPLVARGIDVFGIDSSEAMLAQLRAKPGGDRVKITGGDFRQFDLGQRFPFVFVVFNTLFALPDQGAQLACFAAVARHLLPGGRFLVEAFVPDPSRFDRGQRVGVVGVNLDEVRLECSRHDPVTQTVITQQVALSATGARLFPVQIRYAWPSELDLMAQIAGLQLEARWDGWDRRPYTATSFTTVSVWRSAL